MGWNSVDLPRRWIINDDNVWIRLPGLLPRPATQPTLHWSWRWVHRGFRVVGRMGRMGREIGRRTGAAAAVTGALNQSVVDKRELSRKGRISISCSVYVESLDRDWENQAANTSSQDGFSPQGGRAGTCFTHLVLSSPKVVKGIRESIFLPFVYRTL